MKSYTDLEQSKKLAEILPLESADGFWGFHTEWGLDGDNWEGYDDYPSAVPYLEYTRKENEWKEEKQDIPCWSLSALLGFIKSEIYGENIYGDTVTYEVKFRKYKFTDDIDLYQIAYGSIKFDVDGHYSFKDMVNTGEKENLIDAAFEMVVWLKENKKI